MKDLLRKLSGLPLYEGELEKGSVSMETAKKLADTINFDGDVKELKRGIEVEMEHSETVGDGLEKSARIAKDHLEEDPKYYTKLAAADLTENEWIMRKMCGMLPMSETVNEATDTDLYKTIETIFRAKQDTLSYEYSDAYNRSLDKKLQQDAVAAYDKLFDAMRDDESAVEAMWDKVRAKYSTWNELKRVGLPMLPEIRQQKAWVAQSEKLSELKKDFSEFAHKNINKDAINREVATMKDIDAIKEAAYLLLDMAKTDRDFSNTSKRTFETEWHEWWNAVMPNALMIKDRAQLRSIITTCARLTPYESKVGNAQFKLPRGSLLTLTSNAVKQANGW